MSRVAVRAALVLPVAGHEELGVRVAVRAALFLPVAGHEELGVCVTVRAACLPAGHTHRRLGPESFGNVILAITKEFNAKQCYGYRSALWETTWIWREKSRNKIGILSEERFRRAKVRMKKCYFYLFMEICQ